MKTKIEIYSNKNFVINGKIFREVINQMLGRIEKQFEKIEISFLTDRDLLELNKKYLNHDSFTDILTFPYDSGNSLVAEILISYERAYENSLKYRCTFEEEILRLIAHGILHSIGFKDKTKSQKLKMRKAENDLLNSISEVKFIKKFSMESQN